MAWDLRVLVADDDPGMRRLLHRVLAAAHFEVRDIAPGPEMLRLIAEPGFDLLILDLDATAFRPASVLRIARDVSMLPILALSGEGSAADALDEGADDYLRKPFRATELFARITSALRRRSLAQGRVARIVTGELEIDLLRHRVSLRGARLELPRRAYGVLHALAERAGYARTHRELLVSVWGEVAASRPGYLRGAVRKLRLEIESDPAHPRYILTEPRVGYRLACRPPAADA